VRAKKTAHEKTPEKKQSAHESLPWVGGKARILVEGETAT
jgi:hypothetical protein